MARLHEYQGKALLKQFGIPIPAGGPAAAPEEARQIAEQTGGPVVVKAQAWVTGRAGLGAIRFADTPDQAEAAARDLLGMQIGHFTVDRVMVEQKLAIAREFYAGVIVDDRARAPVVIFSSVGGTGIEQIAQAHPDRVARHTVDIRLGLRDFEAREMARRAGVESGLLLKLGDALVKLYDAARAYDARAAEINPLVVTEAGDVVAADCRFTIDDYAVFRHKDLGIEIAREFDRPPTALERIAWSVERGDYRGTFYFIQMEQGFQKGDGVVGFHGAGGGGSMMSMDAVLARGFKIANFVDTSGNPPASKVYRAAKIILSQPGIDGYFGSGSGVASQEQFHSARGLVKAFMEAPLAVPAVIRLGGNAEDLAVEILHRARGAFPAPIEGYKKDDSPDFCAGRLQTLVEEWTPPAAVPPGRAKPVAAEPYTFGTVTGGTVTLDHARCRACESKVCIETCAPKILSLEGDVPVLNIPREEAKKGGCVECLACEIECYFRGNKGGYVDLPIAGLDEYRAAPA
ncbi:MAG: acetate--CoA ligase family protein [Anaerolineae bacterium]|nr:acetate--CoA ligase family protein [Anaerolineae bacterium]